MLNVRIVKGVSQGTDVYLALYVVYRPNLRCVYGSDIVRISCWVVENAVSSSSIVMGANLKGNNLFWFKRPLRGLESTYMLSRERIPWKLTTS